MDDLALLVREWNWEFDPSDETSLNYAVNSMIDFIEDQDKEYIIHLLRPCVSEAIVSYLNELEFYGD